MKRGNKQLSKGMKAMISIIVIVIIASIALSVGGYYLAKSPSDDVEPPTNTQQSANFLITVNGRTFKNDKGGFMLTAKKPLTFSISSEDSFSISILRNSNVNCTIGLDDTIVSFSSIDFSKYLKVDTLDNGFEIRITQTLDEFIKQLYKVDVVNLSDLPSDVDLFFLVIKNSKKTVNVGFRPEINKLTISKNSIVF